MASYTLAALAADLLVVLAEALHGYAPGFSTAPRNLLLRWPLSWVSRSPSTAG